MKKILLATAIGIMALASSMTVLAAEGWKQNSTGWQYENASGSYTSNGWQKINGAWYYFDNTSYMKTGWVKDGNTWYYLKSSGAMSTGWVKDGNNWYYLKSDGAMKTGWLQDGSDWYYLHSSGAMAYSTTIDGYKIDGTGRWVSGNTTTTSSTDGYIDDERRDDFLRLLNKQRTELGLSKITVTTTAQKNAEIRAKELATSFSYIRPNGEQMPNESQIYSNIRGEAGATILARLQSDGKLSYLTITEEYAEFGVAFYRDSEGVYMSLICKSAEVIDYSNLWKGTQYE